MELGTSSCGLGISSVGDLGSRKGISGVLLGIAGLQGLRLGGPLTWRWGTFSWVRGVSGGWAGSYLAVWKAVDSSSSLCRAMLM